MVQYEAKCPDCSETAHGEEQVVGKFGLRNDRGCIRVQSWCRKCRSHQIKGKYLRVKSN